MVSGFINGFATAACFSVASGGLLPPDKTNLKDCLTEEMKPLFEAMRTKLQPFEVVEAIGYWVGNTQSLLKKGRHWETATELAAIPKHEKPIWLPYKEALKNVNFCSVKE